MDPADTQLPPTLGGPFIVLLNQLRAPLLQAWAGWGRAGSSGVPMLPPTVAQPPDRDTGAQPRHRSHCDTAPARAALTD